MNQDVIGTIKKMVPYLYLGSVEAIWANESEVQKKYSYFLNLSDEEDPFANIPEPDSVLRIRIHDHSSEDIAQYFSEMNTFIQKAIDEKKNVLVFCEKGISRSATSIMAYLIQRYHISFQKAYEWVKARRSVVNPNSGFQQQLIEYAAQQGVLTRSQPSFLSSCLSCCW